MSQNEISGTAMSETFINNSRVRVTEWRFRNKGDNTGWHTHDFDYVIVPLFDGILEIDTADGKRTSVELNHGIPYYRDSGAHHDVISGNEFECTFIEIEVLD